MLACLLSVISCGPPPPTSVSQGNVGIAASTTFGSNVTVTCNSGYTGNGSRLMLTCGAGNGTVGNWSTVTCAGKFTLNTCSMIDGWMDGRTKS